ncbi:hypothetical protein B5M09_013750, partial [Aphanomyces astaci]
MPQGPSHSRPTSVTYVSTRRNLSNDERVAAYQILLERSIGGVLPNGNCGAKKVRSVIDIKMAIKAVPHEGRQTLCSTAVLSGMPKIAILRHMKEAHGLAARTSHLKPLLTDNMLERLWFAVSFVQPGLRRNHSFINMYKNVHVDEKWFFITKVKRRFYLYDDEEMTERATKSKKFITKVMFLAAVARPRYDPHKKQMFDCKIVIWPFVEEEAAVRSSKNRPKGTLELTFQSVNADVYQDMVMDEVVPAIQVKMPRG